MLLTVVNNSTSGNHAIGIALFNFHGRLNAEVDTNTMTGDNTGSFGFGGGLLAASAMGGRTNMNFRGNNSTPANGGGYDLFKIGGAGFFNAYVPPNAPSSGPPADSNTGTLNNSGATIVASPPF